MGLKQKTVLGIKPYYLKPMVRTPYVRMLWGHLKGYKLDAEDI
jgi:hypothetical protein